VLLLLHHGTNLTFQEKAIPIDEEPNCQIGKIFRSNCSKKQFKKNTVQNDKQKRGFSPDLNGIYYARPLKVTKTKRL
jgi:hypothetical protein